mgnify:CR=1 FL=1
MAGYHTLLLVLSFIYLKIIGNYNASPISSLLFLCKSCFADGYGLQTTLRLHGASWLQTWTIANGSVFSQWFSFSFITGRREEDASNYSIGSIPFMFMFCIFYPAFARHCIHNSPKPSCYLLQSRYTEIIKKIKTANKIQNRYTAIS